MKDPIEVFNEVAEEADFLRWANARARDVVEDAIARLKAEIATEEAARDRHEPTTPGHTYHDGVADGLRWALDLIQPTSASNTRV